MKVSNRPFSKVDAAKQIVFGEVYVPGILDSQGEFMTAEQIEKMAYEFLRKSQLDAIDTNHDLVDNGSYVVESFIARPGDPDFIAGSWVVGTKITDSELWKQVENGELNGYSMYGTSARAERVVEIEIPDDGLIKGETIENDGHTHDFEVRFSEDGKMVGGEATGAGHVHRISKGTATEETDGHSHRFDFLTPLVGEL